MKRQYFKNKQTKQNNRNEKKNTTPTNGLTTQYGNISTNTLNNS